MEKRRHIIIELSGETVVLDVSALAPIKAMRQRQIDVSVHNVVRHIGPDRGPEIA